MELMYMKRWIVLGVSVLLGAAVTIGSGSSVAAIDTCENKSATVFGGGNGTSASPYLISTTAHLVALSDDAANDDTWGCYFTQTANIDLSSVSDWRPIGLATGGNANPFYGVYDGGNFSISNLKVTDAGITIAPFTYQNDAGLFGLVRRAVISNVTLVNPYSKTSTSDDSDPDWEMFERTSSNNGFLAGRIQGSVITNITVRGGEMPVTLSDSGAIAGQSRTSTFHQIRIIDTQLRKPPSPGANVTDNTVQKVGAFIGDAEKNFMISNVEATGVVIDIEQRGNNAACREIGGLVGVVRAGSYYQNIAVNSSITVKCADVVRVGGVVGVFSQASLVGADVNTTISSSSSNQINDIGGVFGFMQDAVTQHTSARVDITVTGENPSSGDLRGVGGFAGQHDRSSSSMVQATSNISVNWLSDVDRVGGLIGYTGNDGIESNADSLQYIDSASTIRIESGANVRRVGGFLGGDFAMLSDAVITSSIVTSGSGTHQNIGGMSGLVLNPGTSTRSQLLRRVVVRSSPPQVPASAQSTTSVMFGADVDAFAAVKVPLAIVESVLFDSTIAGVTSLGTSQPGIASTTSQLADVAYLKSQGFDTDNEWCVNAGRPSLVRLTPACEKSLAAVGDRSVVRGRVGVPINPYPVSAVGIAAGTTATFAITPALPRGLALNTRTGLITGTPRALLAPTEYTVTVTDGVRTGTTMFTLSVGKRPKFVVEIADRARGVTFGKNSSSLTRQAKRTLRKLAPRLQNAERVVIQGHVSPSEGSSMSARRRLSERRAATVERFLGRLGVTIDVAAGYDVRRPSRLGEARTPRATVFWLNP